MAPALCARIIYRQRTDVPGPQEPASATAGCAQARDYQSRSPTNWHRRRPSLHAVAATSASAPSADASRGCACTHQGPHGHRPLTVTIASSGTKPPTAVNLNNTLYWLYTKLNKDRETTRIYCIRPTVCRCVYISESWTLCIHCPLIHLP